MQFNAVLDTYPAACLAFPFRVCHPLLHDRYHMIAVVRQLQMIVIDVVSVAISHEVIVDLKRFIYFNRNRNRKCHNSIR